MGFSPTDKHQTTSSTFSNIVDAATGSFTESLTISGSPALTGNSRQAASAFINFTTAGGTPTVENSLNVDSLTDNAVGDYTINFTSGALSTTDYSLVGSVRGPAGNTCIFMENIDSPVRTTAACGILSLRTDIVLVDPAVESVIVFE